MGRFFVVKISAMDLYEYKGEDGAVRIDCPRCKVKIFSKQRNKRKINIEVTLPQQNVVNEYL